MDAQFEKDMMAAKEASLQSADADPSPMPKPHTSPGQASSETDEYLMNLDEAVRASISESPAWAPLKGTCPICTESYSLTHKRCRRSCNHEMCEGCAVRLIDEPCPNCRAPATEGQSFYIDYDE